MSEHQVKTMTDGNQMEKKVIRKVKESKKIKLQVLRSFSWEMNPDYRFIIVYISVSTNQHESHTHFLCQKEIGVDRMFRQVSTVLQTLGCWVQAVRTC